MTLDNAQLVDLRAFLTDNGASSLVIDDLTSDDLSRIPWSGSPGHIRDVAKKLLAVEAGTAEYLVVRSPDGAPIAKGLIDYSVDGPGAEIGQLAVHPELEGLGIATALIRGAEQRVRRRGCRWAELGVEVGHVRAQSLYEKLGYVQYGRDFESWEVVSDSGEVSIHHAEVLLLRRDLGDG